MRNYDQNSNNLHRPSSSQSDQAASFGEILREARLQNNISTLEVANELHVREDIVEAIENCDFTRIPPQGYSRNMIRGYSRMLGLDPNAITSMFLDAEYSYQIGKKLKSQQVISEANKAHMTSASLGDDSIATPRQRLQKQASQNTGSINRITSGRGETIRRSRVIGSTNTTSSSRRGYSRPSRSASSRNSNSRVDASSPRLRGRASINEPSMASSASENYRSKTYQNNNTGEFSDLNYSNPSSRFQRSNISLGESRVSSARSNSASGSSSSRRLRNDGQYAQSSDVSPANVSSSRFSRRRSSSYDDTGRNNITSTERIKRINANDIPDEPIDDAQPNRKSRRRGKSQAKTNFSYMHVYGNKSNKSSIPQNVNIFVVIGIVILLVIALILVLSFVGKKGESSKNDLSGVNIAGLNDVEKEYASNSESDSQNSQSNGQSKEQPTQAVFKYKVKDGATCYMEIYENNSTRPTLAREVKGGETDTFNVTGTLKVVTSSPDSVVFTVDDATVQPVDTNKTGVYTYTVDFAQILKDWQAKNKAT